MLNKQYSLYTSPVDAKQYIRFVNRIFGTGNDYLLSDEEKASRQQYCLETLQTCMQGDAASFIKLLAAFRGELNLFDQFREDDIAYDTAHYAFSLVALANAVADQP